MRVPKIIAAGGVAAIMGGPVLADVSTPHQKPGLWETTMTMMGKPYTSQSCVTSESEAKTSIFSSQLRKSNCSASSVTHNIDGSWTSTSTCKFGGKQSTTHAHVSGDFNSKIEMTMTVEGNSTPETAMTMTWIGACKPGMKGGDVIMNGVKMNVLDDSSSGTPSH